MKQFLLAMALFMVVVSCKDNKKQEAEKTVSPPTDSIRISKEEPVLPNDSVLISLTKNVLTAVKNKNYIQFAEYIHPVAGLRFSPYGFIDTSKDIRLTKEKFLELLKNNKQKITWGSYDGSGESIVLTLGEYFKEFVYDVNFVNPEILAANKMIGSGNTINNLETIYPGLPFTESHFSGFDKKYGGMDWRSLRLVFKKQGDRFFLVAVIHDQWTI